MEGNSVIQPQRASVVNFEEVAPDYDMDEDPQPFDAHVIISPDPLDQGAIPMTNLPPREAHDAMQRSHQAMTSPKSITLQVPSAVPETLPCLNSKTRKKSSSASAEIDIENLENDPDFGDEFNALIRQRRKSFRSGKRGKSQRRSRSMSNRSREGRGSDGQVGGDGSYADIFRGGAEDSSEEEIRENIFLQKDLIATVKNQPWPMKRKLKTLRLAKAYVEKYEGRLSRGHSYQEAGARFWRSFNREMSNLVAFFIPWEMRIKRIESHFGSVVSSYFTFLRWMFWVNIILTIMTSAFIVIPEILVGAPMGSIPRKTVPEAEKSRALNMETVIDFGGYIQHSVLFYGYYGDDETIGSGYRLPLAYFVAGLGTYAFSFIIILKKMARNSRLLNLSSQDEQYVFSWKLFTSWDYMVGNSETTKNKAAEIATNFKESISEEEERVKKQNKKTLLALRILANFLVGAVLASSTYAIILLVERSKEVEKRIEAGEKVGWFTQNEVSLAMSLITALFPSIFDLIGLMEKYHPRVNLRWQLARILVLYFLNLYTLIIALYGKILELIDASKNSTMPCNETLTMTTTVPETTGFASFEETALTNCTVSPGGDAICWETMIGQEIAKLAFFDTIITVGMIILIDFVRGLFVRYFNRCCCWNLEKKFPEYGEFKIAENLLHIIYNQATVWMGSFFSPMLPGLNLVKLLILFYTRSWAVLVCNIPHERVFKASKSNNFYYALTLLMLFLVTLMVGFLLVSLEPSRECGPFTGYSRSYEVLVTTLTDELPSWATPIMDYIVSPGIIIPLFLLLFMAIYYLASVTRSLKEANKDLRSQLIYERTEEKRKIYAMAGGKNNKDDSAASKTTSILEKERARMEAAKSGDRTPVKVLRMANMTPEQAQALRARNPNLKIITSKEAERMKILPPPQDQQPPPKTRLLPKREQKAPAGEQRLEVRRLPALRPNSPTPVAVVHGKPLQSNHPKGQRRPP